MRNYHAVCAQITIIWGPARIAHTRKPLFNRISPLDLFLYIYVVRALLFCAPSLKPSTDKHQKRETDMEHTLADPTTVCNSLFGCCSRRLSQNFAKHVSQTSFSRSPIPCCTNCVMMKCKSSHIYLSMYIKVRDVIALNFSKYTLVAAVSCRRGNVCALKAIMADSN
jgi:hypothetical protein